MLRRLLLGLLLLAPALSACSVPFAKQVVQAASVRAWFDAPLPGTVVRPPNPCQIVAHGASPAGIAVFELSINGAVAASIASPDTHSSLVTLTRDCGLTQPGHYQLQMRVQDGSGQWSGIAETSVIIAGEATQTPTSPANAPSPVPTAPPTLTPTAVAAGSVSVERVSTDLVYIGASTCGPLQVTIVAHATAPKGITVVVLFYRFQGGSSGFENIAMSPIGGDLYQVNLNPTAVLGGVSFDQSTLQYQVVVQQKDGDTSLRTPVIADISVQACGRVAPAASCSSYTDKRSCQAHGCKWAAGAGIVPVYSCQNP